MVGLLREGGYPMWVVVMLAFVVVVMTIRSVIAMRSSSAVAAGRADAILFWGGVALMVGVVGTLIGVDQMARVVERAGNAPAPLVWGGLRLALSSTIAGCLTFMAAFIAWAVLRQRTRGFTASAGSRP